MADVRRKSSADDTGRRYHRTLSTPRASSKPLATGPYRNEELDIGLPSSSFSWFPSSSFVFRPLSVNRPQTFGKTIFLPLPEDTTAVHMPHFPRGTLSCSPSLPFPRPPYFSSWLSPFSWQQWFVTRLPPVLRDFLSACSCLSSVLFYSGWLSLKGSARLASLVIASLVAVTLLSSFGGECLYIANGKTPSNSLKSGSTSSPLGTSQHFPVIVTGDRSTTNPCPRLSRLWVRKTEIDQVNLKGERESSDKETLMSIRPTPCFSLTNSVKQCMPYLAAVTINPARRRVLSLSFISSFPSSVRNSCRSSQMFAHSSSPLYLSREFLPSSACAASRESCFFSRPYLRRALLATVSRGESSSTSSSLQDKEEKETRETEDVELSLAKPRGFCAGVSRAIGIVEEALRIWGPPVFVKHSIVHNEVVCDDLRRKGAIFVEEIKDIPQGAVAIFSAHGVSPAVRAEAEARGLQVVDATCPLVTKVHVYVRQKAQQGYKIVLIGHKNHVEVMGTKGEAPDAVTVVENVADVEALRYPPTTKLFYATQTTLSLDDCASIKAALVRKYPHIECIPSGSVCYATTNRQTAFQKLAPLSDLAIVVGSSASSNAKRLVETATNRGVKAYLVNHPDMIDPSWLTGVKKIALTSSASTPETTTAKVVARLQALGVHSVTEYEGVLERVPFWKFPKNLQEAAKEKQEKEELSHLHEVPHVPPLES
ncbi:4-hydroxy-3-methylbut-2-enyl diphosphate reductase [Cystoisospora suis]|uniref:4-hydroxy-3-methylbut-2-enyl diphosphate reductase n=1 Tax=Cystoisospora suis TaxID=483139 RepID=A0A2C6KN52_9APIC|nr:4-hydroxy-3-methylbut-2-enyl diphosphate reductase [Cystoisospora suis]